jgi:metallo-beta-lactamase family protein
MECTYGDKLHRDPDEAYEELRQVVTRSLQRGGKVIIPCFAVGRTQGLVYNFHSMYQNGDLPHVPVYVDSPMAVNASRIFKEHPECYDAEILDWIQRGHPALEFPLLTYIQSLEDSKALNERKDPMIILSASGMAETGRIVYHIRWNIEEKRNTILIVSWQAPDTLGRRLAERAKEVKILGEMYKCKAEVATIGGLSAHAGQDFLLEYAAAVKGKVRQIFLVHGEDKPVAAFTEKLQNAGIAPIAYPELLDSVEL